MRPRSLSALHTGASWNPAGSNGVDARAYVIPAFDYRRQLWRFIGQMSLYSQTDTSNNASKAARAHGFEMSKRKPFMACFKRAIGQAFELVDETERSLPNAFSYCRVMLYAGLP